jgi:hypothetical protein
MRSRQRCIITDRSSVVRVVVDTNTLISAVEGDRIVFAKEVAAEVV